MIIHASLQTDIANFYSDWILNRLKEGYLDIPEVKNIQRYDFKENELEKIYFWTKNPEKLIQKHIQLKKCGYDFELITQMTFYDKCYEPNIKSKDKAIENIRKASRLFGKNKVSLCYGPIFKTYNCPLSWHLCQIKFLLEELEGYIDKLYIFYEVSENCKNAINYNIQTLSELEQIEFEKNVEALTFDFDVDLLKKPSPQNLPPDTIDIGEKNTCPSSCMYCIGSSNKKSAKLKYSKHFPSSSLLIGNIPYDAKIKMIELPKRKKKEPEMKMVNLLESFL